MIFEYTGFIVHRLALYRYLIIGSGFRGYAASENEARQTIDCIAFRQCEE